jgi:glycosyltransferase involved in cell wall biosynthesis
MRILYFSPRDCWPATTGARLRDFYFAKELTRDAQLTYLGFETSDRASGPIRRTRLDELGGAEVILVPRREGYSPGNLLSGLVGRVPVSVLNYYSPIMAAELKRLLQSNRFDLVQMEGVHLSSYLDLLRAGPKAPRLISDWHNIESELMARYAEQQSLPRRLYAQHTARLLRGMEDQLLRRADAHTVCSEREKQLLVARVPSARIEVLGNGVDVEGFTDKALEEACRRYPLLGRYDGPRTKVLFVGSMNYHANIDAALYCAQEIWPLISKARPELGFVIAGSRPVPEVVALGNESGIQVTGTVGDVRPFYRSAAAVVIPARVGSGTRLKALEAMAAGVPVVSTTLGVEGLNATPGRDVIVADTPSAFAAAVSNLDPHSAQWRLLSEAGRRFVAEHYDWRSLGRILRDLHSEQVRAGEAV